MDPPTGRSISDVLSELEWTMTLSQQLKENPENRAFVSPDWLAHIIQKKIGDLEASVMSTSTASGFEHLSRMLVLYDKLVGENLVDQASQLTLAIVRQRSVIELTEGVSQHMPAALAHGFQEPHQEVGAESVHEGFAVKAFGIPGKKYSGANQNFRLVWEKTLRTLQCFQGRHNLTSLSFGLQIIPDNVTIFLCCKGDPNKVLIKSSPDPSSTVSFFVHMQSTGDVLELFDFLYECSKNRIRRQYLSRQDMDKAVSEFE
ncbi:MAG: hypothetical protein Q9208_004154 [Pyrenodesmia sp. 3 TL-2023]